MEVRDVRENLGKEVFFKLPQSEKTSEYILNAYIFRIDPKNKKKRLKQAELQDTSSPHSVIIASLDEVKLRI